MSNNQIYADYSDYTAYASYTDEIPEYSPDPNPTFALDSNASISNTPTPPYTSPPPPPPPPSASLIQTLPEFSEGRTDDELETLYDKVWTGYGAGELRNFENGAGIEGSGYSDDYGAGPSSPTSRNSSYFASPTSTTSYSSANSITMATNGSATPSSVPRPPSLPGSSLAYPPTPRSSRPLPLPPGAHGPPSATIPPSLSSASVPAHSAAASIFRNSVASGSDGRSTPTLDSPLSARGRQLPTAPGASNATSPASSNISPAGYFESVPGVPSNAGGLVPPPPPLGLGTGLGLSSGSPWSAGLNPAEIEFSSAGLDSGSAAIYSSGYASSEDPYGTGGNHTPVAGGSSSATLRHNNIDEHSWEDGIHAGPSHLGFTSPQSYEQYEQFTSPHTYDEYEGYIDDDASSSSSSFASRYVNFSLLSHIAVQLKDKVPRETHVKGSIPYPGGFTGKDIVSTIQSLIQRELLINHGVSTSDRRAALQVARSLHSQLFFYEVEWGGRVLQDGVEDVYMFLDDLEGGAGSSSAQPSSPSELTELPTGIITALTKCYSPDCMEGMTCYSPRCPRKGDSILGPSTNSLSRGGGSLVDSDPRLSSSTISKVRDRGEEWINSVPSEVLVNLPESEVNRQTIIHKLISKEEQFLADLDTIEAVFIRPLRESNPPIIKSRPGGPASSSPTSISNPQLTQLNALNSTYGSNGSNGIHPYAIGNGVNGGGYPNGNVQNGSGSEDREALFSFIDVVFNNILDLRETNRRLLEILYVRQREQSPIIQRIGDIFLEAATELFRVAYPTYIGGWPQAERRLREEYDSNGEWRTWVEQAARQAQQLTSNSNSSSANSHPVPSTSAYPSSSLPYGSSSDSSSSVYGDSSSSSSSPETSGVMPTVAVNPSGPSVTSTTGNLNSSSSNAAPRLDLKHYLTRPSEHLQKYPVLLTAILNETAEGNPDAEFLQEAIEALGGLQTVAQLRTFQQAMGRGIPGKWEWHDLVSKESRESLERRECKRQSIIFELIKGEMAYAKDLENIAIMYIRPLREADPPIIPRDRLESFITDVFHNFAELHAHHQRLVEKFHEVQTEEFPVIKSVTAAVFDAALNFREAYMEYIPNYPIAAYRIDDEMANNPAFKAFVDQCVRHPDAHRLDMKNFINRPIPRLLRYELLLKGILDETPEGHEDRIEIPQVLDVIKAIGKDTEPGVVSAKQKVELWSYNSNIVFKPGEWIDMDLLDKNRSLIHTGRLLRQPDGGLEWSGWSELFVLLFDNYLVMTKARAKDDITKYFVNRRPIPLDLLTLVNFTDPPTQRGAGLLRNLRGGERHNTTDTSPSLLTASSSTGASGLSSSTSTAVPGTSAPTPGDTSRTDSRSVYPCTIHHNGRMGGNYILYAESASARSEWKEKLEEAVGLRKVVQESNKVFEIETLSSDTFLVPSMGLGADRGERGAAGGGLGPSYENAFTGKVTCSVPFNTPDGRGLVAIGCAEGVWIGFRHDSRSMRRVLHLKMVTQCAMLEDFGIFLVLADKSLFAYHIEALVPSSPSSSHSSQTPQKLSGNKDVYFFSVGTLHGRTLVIYMKKKGLDSIFHVVEPVVERINERSKAPQGLMGSRFGFRQAKSDWFRAYREFFLPSESYDLIFLKVKIAILCAKGFEIMDLMDLQSVTIPQREDPRHAPLAKRWESCKPLGMFRSTDEEFLLCYTEFGLYVNKHGDPSRHTGSIEWEGTAERVALHPPYILLFDTRFIEVRHVQTGRLAQIIPGHDVRCLWDGRGVNIPAPQTPSGPNDSDEHIVQEARVHAVMNAADAAVRNGYGGGMKSRAVAQHVFELIPTIPLYLPGSLASPSTMTYFPQSFSPPHSPTLRPNTIYRS
ncbi:CNH domain-containing protein [Lentinula lateritia]|uniref:CNH domain-containing protein n=1 Tax=Lentinula lateritia TaxID=40482 RepID=A0ABQ8VXA5_9AGAR|nr:CNH domain-containing protein [Lentinula lateritia]